MRAGPGSPVSPRTPCGATGGTGRSGRRTPTPYRPIRTWQVWNEQNTSKYFAPAPDAERYAALLVAAADAIRSVDRRADVALGGMWGPKGANAVVPVASYLKLLYPIPGVRESFDSLSVHPYGKNADDVVEQVREVRRVAASFHDRKASILATELGWASTGPADHWLVKGRRGQARLLRNSYRALLEREERWRIRGAWWYTWQDNPPEAEFICRWCPGAGLIGVDGRRKPAWRAMKSSQRASATSAANSPGRRAEWGLYGGGAHRLTRPDLGLS